MRPYSWIYYFVGMLACSVLTINAHGVKEELPAFDLNPETEVVLEMPDGVPYCSETISVDYPDETVYTVLQAVAELEGFRAVLPPELENYRTSINLRNVTWKDVYDVLLEPCEYAWLEREQGVVVMSQEAYDQLPSIELSWDFIFITPEEFLEYSVLKESATTSVEVNGTALIVNCHPGERERWLNDMESSDTPHRIPHYPQIYWPDELPDIVPGEIPKTPNRLYHTDWVDPVLVAERLKPMLNDGEQVVGSRRSAIIAITASPQRAEVLYMQCEYLDQRKWYKPESREVVDED